MNVDGSTLKWWLNTDKELLTMLLNKGDGSSTDLVREFKQFLDNETGKDYSNVYFWGNGILFDNAMIKQQLLNIGEEYPIIYKNDRDMRTIVELASHKLSLTERELKDKFKMQNIRKHNAIEDCYNQIQIVSNCYRILMWK